MFNDYGSIYNSTKGFPLHVEIHGMAYACTAPSLQNTTFYNYTIFNRSNMLYTDCRIGFYADMDLGDFKDDYVGFDSITRMGITYNGTINDAQYGTLLTQTGLKIIDMDLDNNGIQDPIGSFIKDDNGIPQPGGPYDEDIDCYRFMNSSWTDGTPLVKSCDGQTGTTVTTKYIYADDPSIVGGNSELQCSNIAADRRFIISSSDFNFNATTSKSISFAIVNSPLGSNNANFNVIKDVANAVQNAFPTCGMLAPITSSTKKSFVDIMPTVCTNYLNITANSFIENISILDVCGKIVFSKNINVIANNYKVDLPLLITGNYLVKVKGVAGVDIKQVQIVQ